MRKRKWIISLLAESGRSIRVTFDFFISDLITKYTYICMIKLHFSLQPVASLIKKAKNLVKKNEHKSKTKY
jgi:hypothetical protein